MTSFIILSEVAERAEILAIACSRCDRAVRYPVKALITHYGASMPIPRLLCRLSEECPERASDSHDDLCGVHCPDLPALFRKG